MLRPSLSPDHWLGLFSFSKISSAASCKIFLLHATVTETLFFFFFTSRQVLRSESGWLCHCGFSLRSSCDYFLFHSHLKTASFTFLLGLEVCCRYRPNIGWDETHAPETASCSDFMACGFTSGSGSCGCVMTTWWSLLFQDVFTSHEMNWAIIAVVLLAGHR